MLSSPPKDGGEVSRTRLLRSVRGHVGYGRRRLPGKGSTEEAGKVSCLAFVASRPRIRRLRWHSRRLKDAGKTLFRPGGNAFRHRDRRWDTPRVLRDL